MNSKYLAAEGQSQSRRSFMVLLSSVFVLVIQMLVGTPAFADTQIPTDASTSANAAVDSPTSAAAARPGKWIEVSLAQQRLWAWENGHVVMTSLISSGISRYPTRKGTFKIRVKYLATRMRGPGYNLPGVPYTMYYSGSYAIHGAYWHHNFGHPMSHGCINLPVPFSKALFAWASVGTTVVIH